MQTSSPHILIVEPEFLVALDAEYLITSAIACRTTLLQPDQFDRWDAPSLATIDLCLLDLPFDAAEAAPRIDRLRKAGVPLLLTTANDRAGQGLATLEDLPVIMKPYDGEALIALVGRWMRPPARCLENFR